MQNIQDFHDHGIDNQFILNDIENKHLASDADRLSRQLAAILENLEHMLQKENLIAIPGRNAEG